MAGRLLLGLPGEERGPRPADRLPCLHWYDDGLVAGQLDRLKQCDKSFWVTGYSNRHGGTDGPRIDTLAGQKARMADMVATLEGRAHVFRPAWFTGRWNNDSPSISLLGRTGQPTELRQYHLSLPSSATGGTGTCGAANLALGRPASASSTENGGRARGRGPRRQRRNPLVERVE